MDLWLLSFNLYKLLLSLQIRTIYVGVCLPSTCSTDDIKEIAINAQRPIESHEITLLDVRAPTDKEFNIFTDRTFWILMLVSCIFIYIPEKFIQLIDHPQIYFQRDLVYSCNFNIHWYSLRSLSEKTFPRGTPPTG